mmetsp:Transcript_34027/g.84802  ORF Transcript_34027/g.84802 Transcript_34027/m.84802 type:complete len:334 (-) Transcript_34027:461-1462(-)
MQMSTRTSVALLSLQLVSSVALAPRGNRLTAQPSRRRAAVSCADGFTPVPVADLLAGQVVPCKIVEAIQNGSYLVDIGANSLAMLPGHEIFLNPNASANPSYDSSGGVTLEVGTIFEGQVLSMDDSNITVSLAAVHRNLAWSRAVQVQTCDATYIATVLRVGKAGARLDVEQLPAFLPWSHWHMPKTAQNSSLIGMQLKVKILEIDRSRNRLVVSHRRFQVQDRADQLRPGQLINGTVSSIRPYGAVVNLGDGLDGLLHISQVSRVFIKSVSEVLMRGDSIRCVVIKVEVADGSINLSTKMLEERPGDMLKDKEAVFARANAIEAISLAELVA